MTETLSSCQRQIRAVKDNMQERLRHRCYRISDDWDITNAGTENFLSLIWGRHRMALYSIFSGRIWLPSDNDNSRRLDLWYIERASEHYCRCDGFVPPPLTWCANYCWGGGGGLKTPVEGGGWRAMKTPSNAEYKKIPPNPGCCSYFDMYKNRLKWLLVAKNLFQYADNS